MRSRTLAMSVPGTMLIGGAAGQPGRAETTGRRCDRACLNALVDQYLSALVAHDPSRLPLAGGCKFTENGQRLELGDGLWNTASALGTYKLYVADPQAGHVGYFGTIRENGTPAILALRLRVKDRAISEIETLVARDETGAQRLEKLDGPHPVFLETIPPAERALREELIETANMYFTGLERNDGQGVYPFTDDCNRLENGKQTTNNPSAVLGESPYGMNSGWSSGEEGLSSWARWTALDAAAAALEP